MVTKKIADEIKKTLDGFDEKRMHNQMQAHYRLLHLMDEKGKWATPELQKIASELLPENITENDSKDFVDEVAQIAEKNPYLVKFLEEVKDEKFEHLAAKVKTEGQQVLPDVIAYSIVLERLTKAMYDDFRILKNCVEVFENARKESKSYKYMSWKHRIKLSSIEIPVKKVLLKAHDCGVVPRRAGSLMYSINILEAMFVECALGYKKNARAGWTLAIHRPGPKKYNSRTEARPSVWLEDGRAIAYAPPLPRNWADLYQTWNMAFSSYMCDYPYIIPKLLIPQVANYQNNPKGYIYNRVLALYLCLNYFAFFNVKEAKTNQPKLQWSDHKLTSLWGKSNAESAREYESELARRNVRKK